MGEREEAETSRFFLSFPLFTPLPPLAELSTVADNHFDWQKESRPVVQKHCFKRAITS
jgi:hypothetical protein